MLSGIVEERGEAVVFKRGLLLIERQIVRSHLYITAVENEEIVLGAVLAFVKTTAKRYKKNDCLYRIGYIPEGTYKEDPALLEILHTKNARWMLVGMRKMRVRIRMKSSTDTILDLSKVKEITIADAEKEKPKNLLKCKTLKNPEKYLECNEKFVELIKYKAPFFLKPLKISFKEEQILCQPFISKGGN